MNRFEALSYLSTIFEDHERSFNDFVEERCSLEKIMEQYPEYSGYVLSLCVDLAADSGFNSDVMPRTSDLFAKAAKNTSDKEVIDVFKRLLEKNSRFSFYVARELVTQNPNLAEPLFPLMLKKTQSANINQIYQATAALTAAIASSPENKIPLMMESIFLSDNNELKNKFYSRLADIHQSHPFLEPSIVSYLTDTRLLIPSNYESYFENIGNMTVQNPEFSQKALELIENKIGEDNISSSVLGKAFDAVEKILENGEDENIERCMEILRKGLANPSIERRHEIKALKLLGETEQLKSRVAVFQRGEKTDDNAFGMYQTDKKTVNGPCVLVVGGDGTRNEKNLNGYLSGIYYLLKENKLHQRIPVYGVVYDFGEYMNINTARTYLMEKYGRKIHLKQEIPLDTINPKYIKDIFDKFILWRISANEGKTKIDAEQAADNIRELNIVAHCHGAYTVLKLEEMMQSKMSELGYSEEERSKIQKQLLVLAQSPYCPLGQSKSTFISYASVADREVDHYNNFENSLRRINKKEPVPLCYFPDKQGNIFIVSSMGDCYEQHNFWGYSMDPDMSRDGKLLVLMAAKVLLNGVKNSLEAGGRINGVESLIEDSSPCKKLLKEMKENGQKIYKKIVAESIMSNRQTKSNG